MRGEGSNWEAGDNLDAQDLNQPFFVASGAVTGANLTLYITPGSIRFPSAQNVIWASGVAQAKLIANAEADKHYFLFMRRDGRIVNSGTTLTAMAANGGPPGAPFWDAEPFARIFTGASLSTANLVGPWNQGANWAYDPRAQLAAGVGMQRRIIYDFRAGSKTATAFAASLGSFNQADTASGLSFLSWTAMRTGTELCRVDATICWLPSGHNRQTGTSRESINVAPTFRVVNGYNGQSLASFSDGMHNVNPDDMSTRGWDPDNRNNHPTAVRTTHWAGMLPVAAQAASGARLYLEINPAGNSDTDIAIRVASVSFSVEPGFYASEFTERD